MATSGCLGGCCRAGGGRHGGVGPAGPPGPAGPGVGPAPLTRTIPFQIIGNGAALELGPATTVGSGIAGDGTYGVVISTPGTYRIDWAVFGSAPVIAGLRQPGPGPSVGPVAGNGGRSASASLLVEVGATPLHIELAWVATSGSIDNGTLTVQRVA